MVVLSKLYLLFNFETSEQLFLQFYLQKGYYYNWDIFALTVHICRKLSWKWFWNF